MQKPRPTGRGFSFMFAAMRKRLPLFSLLLAGLGACSRPTDYPEIARSEQKERLDIYYGAPGFNARDAEAWHQLHRTALATARPEGKMLAVHFMDTSAYHAPASGIYHIPGDIRRVIAQYIVTDDGREHFFDDPAGLGKYAEPKN
jgi:hypothetical protein